MIIGFFLVLFKVYDSNDDGFIDENELFNLMLLIVNGKFKNHELKEIVKETIREYGDKNTGKITFEQFNKVYFT